MVDPASPLSYIIILIFLLLSGLFSATESAFINCNKYKIKVLADDGKTSAKFACYLLEKNDSTIITLLIGNNVVNVATSILATLLFVNILKSDSAGSIVSTIVITILVFIFGEIIPKNIGKVNSDKFVINTAIPLGFVMILFFPITIIFVGLIKLVRKIMKYEKSSEDFTEDDFQNVVDKFGQDDVIEEEESEIIIAAIDFGERIVNDVLTKRDNIVALDIKKCTNKYLLRYLETVTYSRIPIYQGSIDNIIGILHVRSYLKEYCKNNKVKVSDCLHPCYVVNSKIKLDDMFKGFNERKTHIAIVKEKNRTIGMITMKDVLEELVNDIDEKGTSDDGGNNE